jgi:hypothetical protein
MPASIVPPSTTPNATKKSSKHFEINAATELHPFFNGRLLPQMVHAHRSRHLSGHLPIELIPFNRSIHVRECRFDRMPLDRAPA